MSMRHQSILDALTANRWIGLARNVVEVGLLALVLSPTIARSDDTSVCANALIVFTAEEKANAAKACESLATRGDAKAQDTLGTLFRLGWGVERDQARALDWYQKSADQGYASAQNNLGWMYESGAVVSQNFSTAA